MTARDRNCETCGGDYKPKSHRQRYCSPGCIPCGTYAGLMAHRKRGEQPCEPCLDAQRSYVKERRKANPDVYQREARRDRARERAAWKLAKKYPRVFQRLYKAELKSDQVGGAP